jgi:arabinogalactan endo-1,4-beta-galactosidase
MRHCIKASLIFALTISSVCFVNCQQQEDTPPDETPSSFYFGADLSYVNQILDHGGIYKDHDEVRSPYKIFKDHGTNLVRLRLWHNPTWTKELYGSEGLQLYNDLKDVEKAIMLSKDQGMQVLLDFHYADTWVDPGKQEIPQVWKEIKSISVLSDSVYQYTFKTLSYLDNKGLMPDLVQIGNETNCGMLYTNAPTGFPACNACDGAWQNLGVVLNKAIDAIRDVSASSSVKTKILLHVADPKNIDWWFDNIKSQSQVTDFDIIGFSYYPIWHTTVALNSLSDRIAAFKTKYNKDIMILETAYPWTTQGDDGYNNIFGSQTPVSGYPFTQQGQFDMIKAIAQATKDGGGIGIIYWEPAWITSNMKDQWGQGSSWENNTFFDFDGNTNQGIEFMKSDYK